LGASVSVYLDGGNSPKAEASTILDMTELEDSYDGQGNLVTTGSIQVVRKGALSIQKIKSVAGDLLKDTN
jgi:tRNA A37 threonylcarbamoyladenosine synthetase subunit TsaC/SUA5/YrdC